MAFPMEMAHVFSASSIPLMAAKAKWPDPKFNYDGCTAFLGFLRVAQPAKMTDHHLARMTEVAHSTLF